MKRLVVTLVLAVFLSSGLFGIPPDELPWGAYYLKDTSTVEIEKLRRDMGFNIFYYSYLASLDLIEDFKADTIQMIMGNMSTSQWQPVYGPERYSYAHYAYMEVGSDNPDLDVRYYSRGLGGTIYGTHWVSTSVDTLTGMDTRHYPPGVPKVYCLVERGYEGGFLPGGLIIWNLDISMKVDVRGDTLTDTVAFIEAWLAPYDTDNDTVICQVPIGLVTADSFAQDDTYQTLHFVFTLPDSVPYIRNSQVKYIKPGNDYNYFIGFNLRICTTGERTVTVDWIKLYDTWGQRLVANDSLIVTNINNVLDDYDNTTGHEGLYAWYLRDEPVFTNFEPFGHIDSLIKATYSDWLHFTFFNSTDVSRSYLYRSDAEFVDHDYYPLGVASRYTGFDGDGNGFQNRMYNMGVWMRAYKQRAGALGKEFWLTPQAFGGGCNEDGEPIWRYPSAGELSCMTFLGLCYKPGGVVFWRYDPSRETINDTCRTDGFRRYYATGVDSLVETDLYYRMRDDINPYIKAIDETYLGLACRDADYISPTHPPDLDIVSTVNGFVNDPDSSSPDIGWFHVGEYEDTLTDGKYFMLVNRACSQDPDTAIEAGSITAIVEIKRGEFDDAERLFVIDIAHEVDSNWNAIPETTYTTLYGSKLYFTTILNAGEGRLFKVCSYNDKTNNILTANNNGLY
jgi:hypothetical protein